MNNIVARLTVTRQNGQKIIVEVADGATFHKFYTYYRQTGNRRSTKYFLRSGSRNDGLTGSAHAKQAGLEALARQIGSITLMNNPVVSSKIRIIKKRAYRKLTTCSPDQLGLTRVSDLQIHRPDISLIIPTFNLLRKINRSKMHAGAR